MNPSKKTSFDFIIFTILFLFCFACKQAKELVTPPTPIVVPLGGNSWIAENVKIGQQMISKDGVANWTDGKNKVRIYFKLPNTGELHMGITLKVAAGESRINVSLKNQTKEIRASDTTFHTIFAGTFSVDEPGYHFVELEGLKKEGETYAEVKEIQLGGIATEGKMYYVKNDFYWGRRGPSVHLKYEIPQEAGDIEWFYNEITVPEGEDVIGSYFMANGFGEGYFGMQVNSEEERRFLFSVWSPFETQDPTKIPDDYKIILLKKGIDVHVGEFGNEGSGGQSYLKYYWKAGNTYKFLLHGKPIGNNFTEYTAYFYAPEEENWRLVASFKRPKTNTYLKHQYSFLENFVTETGAISRKAYYTNQWVRDDSGKWFEISKAKFTADATARKESRMDYAGGVENGVFFMKNCGFFDDTTPIDSHHTRVLTGQSPEIDLAALP